MDDYNNMINMGIDNAHMCKTIVCYCPIGQSYCHYDIDISVVYDAVIPDYLTVDEILNNVGKGRSSTMEDAALAIRDAIWKLCNPKSIVVRNHCADAKHLEVTVETRKDK